MLKRYVVVGATSAIAEQCARLWAQEAIEIILVGRDEQRLERVVADLRVRSPDSLIQQRCIDFSDEMAIAGLAEELCQMAGGIDLVLIAHGSLPVQHECEQSLVLCREAIEVNALSPVLFAEAFARHFSSTGRGTLAVIGSVAGDRGRKSNYIYGAAKGLVERYMQGLQHRFAGSKVQVVLIKPGPTDTPMTSHLKAKGAKLADASKVAQQIVRGIARGQQLIYVPAKWRLIMLVIRHLPRWIFNRMDI